MDLTIVWAVIIAFAVAMYVVMDGFDLGIGILFPGFTVGKERDQAMNAIAPVWDGNETWLVLGGGGLMAAFPLAYAIILPALYAPLTAMLLGLVFRGVAFEFRWRDPAHRRWWDAGFCGGSLLAAFAQGITLGALLQGIHVDGRAYAGGWWDWLTPFSLLTGLSLVVAYAALGASWLVWKTEGRLHDDARRFASALLPVFLLLTAAVSLATPFLEGQYYQRWFEWPGLIFTLLMPIAYCLTALLAWHGIRRGTDATPFLATLGLFALTLVGLGISIWPDVIPGRVDIWQAAAPEKSQAFMLVGAAILVPVILAYTAWSYWVFRGKVDEEGYH
ncbi:cytochrome d ubiquinol oxidase subunit II [Allosphingosinicella indica]|uniref:Cytochrome bd-I ubiquinol oxidase subunit 2 apoprotein n=1 Tax=Allosphingosinicella indica TaxID=941907 RepID=A0A1X7FZR1_9SPHN|nr:cytochrome d ubiquinol oxidase subunit II [Allosphingosinicella indica]SMF61592.1 cytochrome bd-I ubiquinol oxidase subunit 2 apoprotein [Allosphingosinicella indica]